MKSLTIEILKKCRSAFGNLNLFLAQFGTDLLTKAVPALDQMKAMMLWLAEFIAFIGIALLIVKAVYSIYSGAIADGFLILSSCIILAVLCILMGLLMGQPISRKT